jgi:hypothetical protein
VIGPLVGGSAEAQDVLLGNDNFGSELFESPLWTVDDAIFTTQLRTHKRFTEAIKKMAANRTHRCNEKFRVATKVEWQGRIVVTCNRDEESIRALPDLSGSILDKLMLFRTSDKVNVEFKVQEEMAKILKEELPHFAQYLLDWETPEHCKGDVRFGIRSYHEKSLVTTAEQSSHTAGFFEVLDDWKNTYFGMLEKKAEYWEGSAFQLHKAICADPSAAAALKGYDVNYVARQLTALKNKGHAIDCVENEKSDAIRRWRIYKHDRTEIERQDILSS